MNKLISKLSIQHEQFKKSMRVASECNELKIANISIKDIVDKYTSDIRKDVAPYESNPVISRAINNTSEKDTVSSQLEKILKNGKPLPSKESDTWSFLKKEECGKNFLYFPMPTMSGVDIINKAMEKYGAKCATIGAVAGVATYTILSYLTPHTAGQNVFTGVGGFLVGSIVAGIYRDASKAWRLTRRCKMLITNEAPTMDRAINIAYNKMLDDPKIIEQYTKQK